jgi:hypothetical protein
MFEHNYILETESAFFNDIRCTAHIINILAQDILSSYISTSKTG